ncbi:hypothetical protein E4U59_006204 [Claviceps monticola]|nr:hypothetical protein E4U59_006204 [Claviceps monticola]
MGTWCSVAKPVNTRALGVVDLVHVPDESNHLRHQVVDHEAIHEVDKARLLLILSKLQQRPSVELKEATA